MLEQGGFLARGRGNALLGAVCVLLPIGLVVTLDTSESAVSRVLLAVAGVGILLVGYVHNVRTTLRVEGDQVVLSGFLLRREQCAVADVVRVRRTRGILGDPALVDGAGKTILGLPRYMFGPNELALIARALAVPLGD